MVPGAEAGSFTRLCSWGGAKVPRGKEAGGGWSGWRGLSTALGRALVVAACCFAGGAGERLRTRGSWRVLQGATEEALLGVAAGALGCARECTFAGGLRRPFGRALLLGGFWGFLSACACNAASQWHVRQFHCGIGTRALLRKTLRIEVIGAAQMQQSTVAGIDLDGAEVGRAVGLAFGLAGASGTAGAEGSPRSPSSSSTGGSSRFQLVPIW